MSEITYQHNFFEKEPHEAKMRLSGELGELLKDWKGVAGLGDLERVFVGKKIYEGIDAVSELVRSQVFWDGLPESLTDKNGTVTSKAEVKSKLEGLFKKYYL